MKKIAVMMFALAVTSGVLVNGTAAAAEPRRAVTPTATAASRAAANSAAAADEARKAEALRLREVRAEARARIQEERANARARIRARIAEREKIIDRRNAKIAARAKRKLEARPASHPAGDRHAHSRAPAGFAPKAPAGGSVNPRHDWAPRRR